LGYFTSADLRSNNCTAFARGRIKQQSTVLPFFSVALRGSRSFSVLKKSLARCPLMQRMAGATQLNTTADKTTNRKNFGW
jgi:hypothetical protein